MKTSLDATRDAVLRHTEAQLEESIVSLFGGFPSLCGFSVQERPGRAADGSATLDNGLYLTEVGLYPAPAIEEAKLICEEIRITLLELLQERPEAHQLLRGRTFARTVH